MAPQDMAERMGKPTGVTSGAKGPMQLGRQHPQKLQMGLKHASSCYILHRLLSSKPFKFGLRILYHGPYQEL